MFEYKIYPIAGRAFFNDAGRHYDPAAAKDARAVTLAFPRRDLK